MILHLPPISRVVGVLGLTDSLYEGSIVRLACTASAFTYRVIFLGPLKQFLSVCLSPLSLDRSNYVDLAALKLGNMSWIPRPHKKVKERTAFKNMITVLHTHAMTSVPYIHK